MTSQEGFEQILAYSPYHQKIPDRDISCLYIGADFDQEYYTHAIKFIAKYRETSRKHGNTLVLREYQRYFPPSWVSEDLKLAQEFAFLIHNSAAKVA